MANDGPLGLGPQQPPPNGGPMTSGGGMFSGLLNQLGQITQALYKIQQTLGGSFISLAGNNVFTGTNTFDAAVTTNSTVLANGQDTFKLPPIINAGAVGIGTFLPEGLLSKQLSIAGIGNGADTTDDTLFSYSLPASSLDVVGRQITVFAFGKFATNGHDKTVKIFLGSTLIFTSAVQTGSNVGWQATLTFYKSGASTQLGTGIGQSGTTTWAVPVPLTGSETDTGALTIKVTGASPTTGAANDVLANGMVVQYAN